MPLSLFVIINHLLITIIVTTGMYYSSTIIFSNHYYSNHYYNNHYLLFFGFVDLPRFRQLVRALSLAALAGAGRAGGPWAAGGGVNEAKLFIGKTWGNHGKMIGKW